MKEQVNHLANKDLAAELLAAHAVIRESSGPQRGKFVSDLHIEAMDGIEGGLFLSQLIFWHDKGGTGDGWFYKSYEEWRAETHITKYGVRKYAEVCKEAGFLETKVAKANGAPTVFYKVDLVKYTLWLERIVRKRTMESLKTNDSTSECERSYKHIITTDNNYINNNIMVNEETGQSQEQRSTTSDFARVTDYWRVSITGKKPSRVVEDWLWGLYLSYQGEVLYEALVEAARNNNRGTFPGHNFVRAICERMRKENEQSEQRRLAISGAIPTESARYLDPALDRLRGDILNERHNGESGSGTE